MTRRAKLNIFALILGIFTMGAALGGCGSWQPSTGEGKCSPGRQWVPPKTDPDTGAQTEGYCEWLPGER